MIRPPHEIVLRYLCQGEGERTVKLYPEHSLEFGMYGSKLHHILRKANDEEMWCVSDMQLNEFIKLCEQISEETLVGYSAVVALTNTNRKKRSNKDFADQGGCDWDYLDSLEIP